MSKTLTARRARSIVLAAWEVRAFLEGRKTQLRRAVVPQPTGDATSMNHCGRTYVYSEGEHNDGLPCPFGQPGDTLWVKETWAPVSDFDPKELGVLYRADMKMDESEVAWSWRPSTHMREADSRLALRIESIRVERVHQITDADVIAEGIEQQHIEKNRPFFHRNDIHAIAFAEHWDLANAKRAPWSSNPWCWALTVAVSDAPAGRESHE